MSSPVTAEKMLEQIYNSIKNTQVIPGNDPDAINTMTTVIDLVNRYQRKQGPTVNDIRSIVHAVLITGAGKQYGRWKLADITSRPGVELVLRLRDTITDVEYTASISFERVDIDVRGGSRLSSRS